MATSASGASQGGSSEMNGGLDFSRGSRLMIPQRMVTSVHIGPGGVFNGDNAPVIDLREAKVIDVTTSSQFADAAIYPRQFEVNFSMSGLFVKDCQIWTGGEFVVSSLDVKQDVSGSGAHLKIERVDGHYLLTHDGAGEHQLRVTGAFQTNHTPDSGGVCPSLPMGAISVPIAFTTNISIAKVSSVKAWPPSGCSADPSMLSGRNFPGLRISLLDESGQPIPRPDNVYNSYPLDVIVETEKPAQIAETSSGLYMDGLIVTGEPQTVRLSTSYGTLFTYQLANAAMIDAWDVKFWSRDSQYPKSATYPLATDIAPQVSPGKEVGATAVLEIGGLPICGPTLATDFMIGLPTPNVCKPQSENGNWDMGTPGFLATFVDEVGTCELDLSVPAANGGRGLATHLSATLQPGKLDGF